MGMFTSVESANATNESFFPREPVLNIYQDTGGPEEEN
jgi:hypothetical protein